MKHNIQAQRIQHYQTNQNMDNSNRIPIPHFKSVSSKFSARGSIQKDNNRIQMPRRQVNHDHYYIGTSRMSGVQKYDQIYRQKTPPLTPRKGNNQSGDSSYCSNINLASTPNSMHSSQKSVNIHDSQNQIIYEMGKKIEDLTKKLMSVFNNMEQIFVKLNNLQTNQNNKPLILQDNIGLRNEKYLPEIRKLLNPSELQNCSYLKLDIQFLKKQIQKLKTADNDSTNNTHSAKNLANIVKQSVNSAKASLYKQMLQMQVKLNKSHKQQIKTVEQHIQFVQKQLQKQFQTMLLPYKQRQTAEQKLAHKLESISNYNHKLESISNYNDKQQADIDIIFSLKLFRHVQIVNVVNKINKQTIENSEMLYYVDKQYYLLDCNKQYILDQQNLMIKLSQNQVQKLKKQGFIC